ncbi:MAG TPA: hypothetical protein VG826_09115 [Pirellulales bacterium]|nr:hypothetical protein [Pirellulales bacterium]
MRKLPAFSRYRPPVVTLLALLLIGALLVLANLTDEVHPRGAPQVLTEADLTFDVRKPLDPQPIQSPVLFAVSSGWPLLWKQYVLYGGYGVLTVGWRYSPGRLACDVAMWLILLAAPAAACEWALRRYRPRFRFSLRGMLATVTLAAALCGWIAWARQRADTEDTLIDAIKAAGGEAWLERWGPKWLDLIGADRYRRHLVAASVPSISDEDDEQDDEATSELLRRLSRLPALQYLFLHVQDLTPELARALREFRQLRMLSIDSQCVRPGACAALGESLGGMSELRALVVSPRGVDYEDAVSDDDWYVQMCQECLMAVGKATSLERLRLEDMTLRTESLAELDGLTRLKSLSLMDVEGEHYSDPPLLSGLPPLPNLEAFEADSGGTGVGDLVDDDLRYLARLPRLKSLRLSVAALSEDGFAQLASLNSIEELSLTSDLLSSTELESLARLEHLRKLHVQLDYRQPNGPDGAWEMMPHVGPGDLGKSIRALQTLRQAHPGIVIDNDFNSLAWHQTGLVPAGCDNRERAQTAFFHQAIDTWEKAGCPPIPAAKPAK